MSSVRNGALKDCTLAIVEKMANKINNTRLFFMILKGIAMAEATNGTGDFYGFTEFCQMKNLGFWDDEVFHFTEEEYDSVN